MSGWTPDTLLQHIMALRDLDQQHRAMTLEQERFWRLALWNAHDRAVAAALDAANKRLDGMNEFRKTIEDLQGAMLPRKEAWGFLVGGIGMVVALITIIDKFIK